MNRYDKITPEGTRDLLFAECEAQKEITAVLHKVFEEAGFHQVITPGFEFYDVFSANSMYFPQESMYKLMDNKGRIMVARPDSTIPIARIKATRLKGCPLPLRLYYGQPVYRQNSALQGRSDEIMQMGIELIGDSSFESDMEVLTVGGTALSACKQGEYRLELGHVGIFNLLMERLDAEAGQKRRIHELITSKNYTALSEKLNQFEDSQTVTILKGLPKLFGGEEVFQQAKKLFNGYDPQLLNMCNYLENIYDRLKKGGLTGKIIVDFGLVNQADYYTSIVFRGYIPTVGEPVLSGGRYDNLLKDFGEDLPATGFAINVSALTGDLLMERQGNPVGGRKNGVLRIALTKGRLEKKTIELFEAMGFDCRFLNEKGRKLLLTIPDENLEVVLAKSADVITYVEKGVCDLGVVGLDTILESGGTFYEVLDLGFGKCRFSLAVPEGKDFYGGYSSKRIATKYPKVAREFFEEKAMDVEVIKIEGSVELAPMLSLADGIVDLVETGTTLKENGLEVIEDIRNISARLIVNETSMKLKKEQIDLLIDKIQGVMA
ncbi:MAG: ATP phosphoribosyltransferase regulatory subunit [Anaerovoracaceae bacterium]|jgi:ATP phosphoribosyltransferase regulatory subunit/ATP phosphoribosyltransferase